MKKSKKSGTNGAAVAAMVDGPVTRESAPAMKSELKVVPLAAVVPDPEQPRKVFEEGPLQELAESIRAQGILQPPLVWFRPAWTIREPDLLKPEWFTLVDEKDQVKEEGPHNLCLMTRDAQGREKDSWQLIAGERRWRAAGLAGLTEIPVLVVDLDEKRRRVVQLIENQARENLSALEEAAGYAKALEERRAAEPGFKVDQLAVELGVSRGTVYNRLGLLKLAPAVQEALKAGKIDKTVAGLVGTIPEPGLQLKLLELITDEEDYQWPFSFRNVQEIVERDYCKCLKTAPWELGDAELVVTRWEAASPHFGEVTCDTVNPPRVPSTSAVHAARNLDGETYSVFVSVGGGQEECVFGPTTRGGAQTFAQWVQEGRPVELNRIQGGACADCPWRSGNRVELPAGTPENICTRPACYAAKLTAHFAREAKEREAKGEAKVLSEKEFKRVKGSYVDAQKYDYSLDGGSTWAEALGKSAPAPVLVATAEGVKEFYAKEDAVAAAKKRGIKMRVPVTPEDKEAEAAEKKARAELKSAREKVALGTLPDLVKGIERIKDKEAWALVLELLGEDRAGQNERWKALKNVKGDRGQVVARLLGQWDASPVYWDGKWKKELLPIYAALGVDLVAREKEAVGTEKAPTKAKGKRKGK